MLQRAIMLAALSSLTHHLFADTEQVKVYFDRQDLSTIQDPGCGAKSQDLLSVDDVFKQSLPQRLKYLNDYQKCIPQWYGADIKDMKLLPKVKGWSLVHDPPIKRTSTYTHEKGDTAIPHVVNAIQSSSSSKWRAYCIQKPVKLQETDINLLKNIVTTKNNMHLKLTW